MSAQTAINDLAMKLLGQPYEGLTPIQKSVIDLMAAQAPTGAGLRRFDERTFGQKLADQVAAVGGSWAFIGAFALVLVSWIALNVILAVQGRAFDPYPFILLNLVLSTLAAIQAPVIMMSQNRQAAKDRIAAEHDYKVNLRAELEIMSLHEKLDALRDRELVELVKAQGETLALLRARLGSATGRKG